MGANPREKIGKSHICGSKQLTFFYTILGLGMGEATIVLLCSKWKLSVNTELFSVSYLNNSGTEITTVLQFSLCD